MDKKNHDDNLIDLSEKVYKLEKENQNLKNQLKEKDKIINILTSENNILKEKISKYENKEAKKKDILDFVKSKQIDINELNMDIIDQNKNIDINNNNNEPNISNFNSIFESNNDSLPFQNNSNNSNINLYPNIDKNKNDDIINDKDILISNIKEPIENNIKKNNENHLENLDLLLAMQMQFEMDKEYKKNKNIRNYNDVNRNLNNNFYNDRKDFKVNNYNRYNNNNNNNNNNSIFKENFNNIINQMNYIGPNIRYNYNPQQINRFRPNSGNEERNLMAISKIDSMSYEELLELEKKMGKVSQGLSKEQIDQLLFETYNENNNKEDNICTICKNNFENGEKIRRLGCNHIFHMECIDHWLLEKKNCPICLNEIKFDE